MFSSIIHKSLVPYLVGILFSIGLLRLTFVGFQISNGEIAPYAISEWLINYSGGFVRRGLLGQLFLNHSPGGLVGITFIVALGLLILSPIFYLSLIWLRSQKWNWASFVLVCNPAALLFVAWDTGSFLRKESIGIAAMSLVVTAYSFTEKVLFRRILVLSAVLLYLIAVLASEVNSFLLPFFVYILWKSRNLLAADRFLLLTSTSLPMLSVLGIFVAAFFQGNSRMALIMCDSLLEKGVPEAYCGNAMGFIGEPITTYIGSVLNSYPAYFLYIPLFVLSVFPIITHSWFKLNKPWFLSFLIFVAPLFVIAVDYGRWISLFVLGCLICIMSEKTQGVGHRVWKPMTSVLFVFGWGLPHYLNTPIDTLIWLGPIAWILT
jgi:hypothetical protein